MKRPLKFAINVLASLLIMVSGTMQAAQADEVWLDFSVPEADVTVASTAVENQPSRPQKTAGNAKLIALDFSVQNVEPFTAPIAVKVPQKPEQTKIKPRLPKVKKPLSKPLLANSRSKQVTALRRAIIGQESAGKYNIVNPHSGALGYGQLMQDNVAPWTKAALGRALTPEEFLASPELQIKTIEYKLNEYLERDLAYSGNNEELAVRRVASRWYSGNPNLWNNADPQYYNGWRYPSIASYTGSVWKRYLREIG